MRYYAILATIFAAASGATAVTMPVSRPVIGPPGRERVVASGYDKKPTSCRPNGCLPENTVDGSVAANSRWSCQRDILDSSDEDEGCWILYYLEEPQDIARIHIAFHLGNTRTRTLDVFDNGNYHSTITSSGSTLGYQSFDLYTQGTDELMLRLADDEDVWLSITEVMFLVS